MKRILVVSIGLSLLVTLTACSEKVATNNCIDRGMEYHKGTGADKIVRGYPNTGLLVVDVVKERCIRSTTAY